MDLDRTPTEQVEQLIQWMRDQAADDAPPSQTNWLSLQQGLKDRAQFLETFVLRSVTNPSYTNKSNVTPEFLRGTGTRWNQTVTQETNLEEQFKLGRDITEQARPSLMEKREHGD